MADAGSLAAVRELRVEYPNGKSAVDGVTFTMRRGEVAGLLGESGCGKTTLALALAGLLPREARVSGGVEFEGQAIGGRSEAELRALRGSGIGFLFQEPLGAFHPLLNLRRQIIEAVRGRVERGGERAAAEVALEAVGLSAREFGRAWPHQLSGGQLQRAQLAQVMAARPKLVLADEPTAALDAGAEKELLDLLIGAGRGAGILLISHEPELLRRWAGRVMVMYAGRLVESGAAARVLDEPRHPYTAALLACGRPAAEGGRLAEIPGRAPEGRERPVGCAFAPRCPRRMAVCGEREPPAVEGGVEVSCWLDVA